MTNEQKLKLENIILTLESHQPFCDKLENHASGVSPTLFEITTDSTGSGSTFERHNVVKLSYAPFLSYSAHELFTSRIGDIIRSYNGELYDLDHTLTNTIAEYFATYYYNEIKLGTTYLPNFVLDCLDMYYTNRTSKKAICDKHNLSYHKLNQLLICWPEVNYKRLLEVQEGKRYIDVMSEAENATAPHKTIYALLQQGDKNTK